MGEELVELLLVLQESRKAWGRKREEADAQMDDKEWGQLSIVIQC